MKTGREPVQAQSALRMRLAFSIAGLGLGLILAALVWWVFPAPAGVRWLFLVLCGANTLGALISLAVVTRRLRHQPPRR